MWARESGERLAQSQTVSESCPEAIEPLIAWMLQDLPSYANRVIQRSGRVGKSQKPKLSVFIAGKPEFKPLTLGPGVYSPRDLTQKAEEETQQVFFTTWERSYQEQQIIEFQNYHWAFLTRTTSGWRLAAVYSSLGSYPTSKPPTPIRESSEGVIGQGIKLWLRDCAVGKLRSRSLSKAFSPIKHHK
ncbi:hypothetical protein C7B64_21335 [Merismopedia glauca CCAP 1448/3]|uniref:Uncharacterized protein n=1 Tax=Merismopedia glauca CCAP 1448/3 TaxID=1296344 RepID=A0A2T1BXW7_9CYAN|nr:hypothetical protein C7B64_21335 [Merismopedia glauca CCAP 1448/3]